MAETLASRAIVGTRIGSWQLQKLLGRGAFGSTWRALSDDGRLGAIKLLNQVPGDELRALSSICHPAVIGVLDSGNHPCPYLVMDLAEGRPLRAYMGGRGTSEAQTCAIGAVLADALAAVHEAGIAHGDIKPENIVLDINRASRLWLVDFGLTGGLIGSGMGGTLSYSAPERTQGTRASIAADIYAMGLILWEMLHGYLPWPELGVVEAIVRRRYESPQPTMGAPWLRDLLSRMLAVHPHQRPTAAEIADSFAANGFNSVEPDAIWLQRRSRSVHLPRPEAQAPSDAWLEQGGALAILGPPGSGRSHWMDRLAIELRARGRHVLRLSACTTPWALVEHALTTSALEAPPAVLPNDIDPIERAISAAKRLQERVENPAHLSLLVSDIDSLDAGTLYFLDACVDVGFSVVITGTHAPRWARHILSLAPLQHLALAQLSTGILGGTTPPLGLVERLEIASGGLPGPAVALILAAVRSNALTRRARRWLVDIPLLDTLMASNWADNPPITLSNAARSIGGLLACLGQPVSLETLQNLAEQPVEIALNELAALGLAHVSKGQAACAGIAQANTLRMGVDAPAIHAQILHHLSAGSSTARIAFHAVHAGHRSIAQAIAPEAIADALQRDPGDAARLADALYTLVPSPELAGLRMDALLAAGRMEEARRFGEGLLQEHHDGPEDVPVLLALARLYVESQGSQVADNWCTRARAALGTTAAPETLLIEEARCHQAAKRYHECIEISKIIADLPPRASATAISIERWLRARIFWAQSLHAIGQLNEGIRVLNEVPATLWKDRPVGAELQVSLGRLYWHAGRLQEAAQAYAQVSGMGTGLSAIARARLLNNLGLVRYQTGARALALSDWEQALLLFERIGDVIDQIRVNINLCVAYKDIGRWDRARIAGQNAVADAKRIDAAEYEAMAAGNLGDVYVAIGDWPDAETAYARAQALADTHGFSSEKVELARRHAELAVLRRDPGAQTLCYAAERAALAADAFFELSKVLALKAVCMARRGMGPHIYDLAQRALEPLQKSGASGELAEVRTWIAEAHAEAGHIEDAVTEATLVRVYADEVGNALLHARASAILARVHAGRITEASAGDILDMAVAVARERNLGSLLQRIADAGRALLHTERCFVILIESGRPVVASISCTHDAQKGEPSMSIVQRSLSEQREIIVTDLGERSDLLANQSVRALELRSVICVPMVDGERTVGALYMDSRVVSNQTMSESARLVRALAAQAAVAVGAARHLQETARRSEIASEIAHDIRSPMHAIESIATELLARGLEPTLALALEDIREESRRAADLATRFLEENIGQWRSLDMVALCARVCAVHRHIGRARQIQVILETLPEAWIKGDSDELRRAISNLLGNAIKYSPDRGNIYVTLHQEEQQLHGCIRDEGPGIPIDILPWIFYRGVQGPDARPGHGLGLAIAKNILEAHGGRLYAENHTEGGAVFSFTLPLATTTH